MHDFHEIKNIIWGSSLAWNMHYKKTRKKNFNLMLLMRSRQTIKCTFIVQTMMTVGAWLPITHFFLRSFFFALSAINCHDWHDVELFKWWSMYARQFFFDLRSIQVKMHFLLPPIYIYILMNDMKQKYSNSA
jgi:hypothetical protein